MSSSDHQNQLDSQWSGHFINRLKMEELAALYIEQSPPLHGNVTLSGAKNAVLVSIASLILTTGKSILKNVPCSADVAQMIELMKILGAQIFFDTTLNELHVDATHITGAQVPADLMDKMRASVLVMGPLLARFGHADITLPGGCLIGERPIDFHLRSFEKMGVHIEQDNTLVKTYTPHGMQPARIVLPYPSVGATENIIMAAALTHGTTTIVNAALEPEVLDLIALLKKMGACIEIMPPAVVVVTGVSSLQPVEYAIMPDRLEAGGLLLAAAMTKGSITIANCDWQSMEVFLEILNHMGHQVMCDASGFGVSLKATHEPIGVKSIKTGPYPGFPTDLQAPTMAALSLARGKSVVYETVFENRLLHVRELVKLGAQITVDGHKATIIGVDTLYGTSVIATDIRASCALVLAGLVAQGTTIMNGLHHWRRGYDNLDTKLVALGARLQLKTSC